MVDRTIASHSRLQVLIEGGGPTRRPIVSSHDYVLQAACNHRPIDYWAFATRIHRMLSARMALKPRELLAHIRSDRLIRNSAIFLAGSVLAGFFGYVFHFETGHLLGPSAYAVVASAIAALYLLTLPVVGLQLVSARFASLAMAADQPHAIVPMLLRVSGFSMLFGLPISLVLVLFSSEVAHFLNLSDHRVVYVLAFAGLVAIVITVNRGALQGMQRFVALSGNLLVDMGSRLVLAGALIFVGFGALGAVAAMALGPAVAYVQSFFLLRRPIGAATGTQKMEGIGGYAVLATVASVGTNYLFSVDTLLAKHYLASEAAGIYAAAAVLARVVYFLSLSVAGAMFPEVATLHARNEAHFHVVEFALLLVAGMGLALIAAYSLFPGLVLFPYGAGFSPARPYLGLFALALTLLALANLLINYFLSIARTAFLAPLFGACVVETLLIAIFHASIWQILTMVLITLGLLSVVMGLLYSADRFGMKRVAR